MSQAKIVRIHRHRRQLPIAYEDDYRPERMLGAAVIGILVTLAIGVIIWALKHS